MSHIRDHEPANSLMILEAPPGFEPGVEVLQTSALPLGDGAPLNDWVETDDPVSGP